MYLQLEHQPPSSRWSSPLQRETQQTLNGPSFLTLPNQATSTINSLPVPMDFLMLHISQSQAGMYGLSCLASITLLPTLKPLSACMPFCLVRMQRARTLFTCSLTNEQQSRFCLLTNTNTAAALHVCTCILLWMPAFSYEVGAS